jgi:hypothetical protein
LRGRLKGVSTITFLCTDLESFLLGGFKVLFLANVGHEADNIVALLDEPCEDA